MPGEGNGVAGERNLISISREWANMLGLAHWKISVRWANKEDIEEMGPHADANIKYKICPEYASIRIKRKEDCTFVDESERYDAEELIVHELLHLVFAHFPDGEPDDLRTELFDTGIDRVARCLVKLKGGVGGKDVL